MAATLANMPEVIVSIAFDNGPYVANPTWTDVTAYVREVSIRRGRQDDLQQFPSGQASVTLDNRARLFDPFNTASTYNGKLKPRRQIKIVGQWAGVNYPLFRGFVAGWPVEYSEGGKDSTVTIDCFDALGLLATEVLPVDWVYDYTLSLGPNHYWRFNDVQPVQTIRDVVGGWTVTPFTPQSVIYEVKPLSLGLKSNALFCQDSRYGSFPSPANNHSMTFVSYIRATADIALVRYHTQGTHVQFAITSSDITVVAAAISGTTQYLRQYRFGSPTLNSTDTVHFAVTVQHNGATYPTVAVYINGAQVTLPSPTNITSSNQTGIDFLYLVSSELQEMSTYPTVLSASQVSNLYNYAQARINESTSQRFTRLTTETDFPLALTAYSGTPASQVSDIGQTQSILTEIQQTVASEAGEVLATADGTVTFFARNYWASRTRSNTSQVNFTDTGTGVYYDANAIRVEINADQVRNDVNVQFTSGGQVSSSDASSIAEFGAANETVNTYLASPTEAQTLADYIVSIYSEPKIRVEPFLVKGQRNPSYDWPRLLALDLLDRFTFVRTPSVGSAISKPMLLQSIEHRFTPGTWETTINGSARYTGWFVLDSSLLDGEDVLL